MKAFHIFLFILASLVLIVLLSVSIPNGRIEMGSLTLKFPTPEQVLKLDKAKDTIAIIPPWEQAEAQIREHLQQKQLNKREQIAYKIVNTPTAIAVPNDSLEYFFRFFAALEDSQEKPMRILHLGDAQIEEARSSGVLRDRFQSGYGGHGPGLVPAIQTIHSSSIRQSCSRDMKRYMVYGPAHMRHPENLYGIMGQMAQLSGEATWNFRPAGMYRSRMGTKHYSKVTFMIGQPQSNVQLYASRGEYNTDTITIDTTQVSSLHFATLNLQGYGAEATVTMNGETNIYGILLDGASGVSLDNIPMRGSAGTIFTSIDAKTLKPYFQQYYVPLIILQFGGNTVPYLKGEKSIANYCAGIARQISYLKRISPHSTLLFIGPSDMATNVDGVMQTYPELPRIVQALKTCCLENNIAYWDLYAAMGGYNSMTQWDQIPVYKAIVVIIIVSLQSPELRKCRAFLKFKFSDASTKKGVA